MELTYILNGKIVLPDSVVCGKSLAFDSKTAKISGVVDTVPSGANVIDAAGIELDENASPAEKLKVVQGLMAQGDERAVKIYETIGVYFGYAVAY